MGFLRRLFGGGPATADEMVDAWMLSPARGDAVLQVVGEGSYQKNLAALGGRRTTDGPTNVDFVAGLIREPQNKYDENAIAVQIDGRLVGYLSREDAIRYRPVVDWAAAQNHAIAAQARLTGGWDNGHSQGSFGVVLHVGSPGETLLELLAEELSVRNDHPWPGLLVAFTGDSRFALKGVPIDRELATTLANRAGLHVYPRVTKKVQILVDCDPNRESGNELKALEYGIPVVDEKAFWEALGVPVEPAVDWGRRPGWQTR